MDGKLVQSDEDDTRLPDQRTAEVVRDLANTILPNMLELEEDYPSKHQTQRLPILDLEVWIEGDQICHTFYQKAVANKKVVMARSALSASMKRSILVQEGIRRLKNTSPDLPWAHKLDHLNGFMLAMYRSGHQQPFRTIVAKRVIAKYQSTLSNHQQENPNMYRSKQERKEQIVMAGGRPDKSDWYKKLGKEVTVTVPATVDSKLAEEVRDNLKNVKDGDKYLVLEDGGRSIHQDLIRSNFGPRANCDRPSCLPCQSGPTHGKCYKPNIGYRVACAREPCTLTAPELGMRDQQRSRNDSDMEDDNSDEEDDHAHHEPQQSDHCPPGAAYEGETSRTAFTRGQQHLQLYRGSHKQREKSFMWHHTREVHGGVIGDQGGLGDYKMEVVSRFSDPMSRILEEAVRIREAESLDLGWSEANGKRTICLNGKLEYFQSQMVNTNFSKGSLK